MSDSRPPLDGMELTPNGGIDPTRIGQMIRELRFQRNLTQRQLAEMCALSVSHVSKIESGQSSPSFATLNSVSTVLGFPASMLLVMADTTSGSANSELMKQLQDAVRARLDSDERILTETTPEPVVVKVSLFTDEHYKSLLEDPDELLRITDEQFEQLVLDRFSAMGLGCKRVGKTRHKDGGVDIVAWPEDEVEFPYLIAAQVKHHQSRKRKTGVGDIRDMHGVLTSQVSEFHFGVIVTNTSFTADAMWFASKNQKLLRLRGLAALQRWMKNDFADSAVTAEIPEKLELGLGVEIEIPKKEIWLPEYEL